MSRHALIFIFTLFAARLWGGLVEEGLQKLSLQERIYLEKFFEEAVERDQAAHVLYFTNKAVCLTGPVLKDRDKSFKDVQLLKGWVIFKKNEHLFPHPNFLFSESIFKPDNDFRVLHIYIINKNTLTKCLNQNLDLFRELIPNFSIEEFIALLEQGMPLPALLRDNEELLGVLLGFGTESSKAFRENTCDVQPFAAVQTEEYQRIDLKCPKDCAISPVVFMGNPNSKEVQALSSIYEEELAQFWEYYRNSKEHLKVILRRLCET
jgi:hypothetical protein